MPQMEAEDGGETTEKQQRKGKQRAERQRRITRKIERARKKSIVLSEQDFQEAEQSNTQVIESDST